MDYRSALCQALNLPTTATDGAIAVRLAQLVTLGLKAGATPFNAQRGNGSRSVDAEVALAIAQLSSFGAAHRQDRNSAELQVARQMGVSAESLARYGSQISAR